MMVTVMMAFTPFFAFVSKDGKPDYENADPQANQEQHAQKNEPIRRIAVRSDEKFAHYSPGPEGAVSAPSPAIFMFNFCIR